jgi:hypothetical protein
MLLLCAVEAVRILRLVRGLGVMFSTETMSQYLIDITPYLRQEFEMRKERSRGVRWSWPC